MRVMTLGTSSRYPRVRLVAGDIFLIMAVKAELHRFRGKEKGETGAMGIVAYLASTGGDRAVNMLLIRRDNVAVKTEFLDRQYQGVRPSLMAAYTQLGRVRAVLPICRSRHARICVVIT